METSININESLDMYERDSLTLEKRKQIFIEYITDIENGKYLMPEENSFNEWTIWFDDEMIIFNITDDAKGIFKGYIKHIKMNDKNITQWIVYKNIMAIFNITHQTQENFIKYISTKNNELKDKKTNKSKDNKKPSYYEYLNVHPKNIRTSRPGYENYAETEELKQLLENYNTHVLGIDRK